MLNDLKNIRSFDDIRLLYFKYKDTPQFMLIFAALIGIISMVILGRVTFPQIENWFSLRREVKATKDRIAVLKANINTLNTISDSELTKQFAIATSALPYEKDYTGVITTIDSVAVASGVALEDYSFQVGNLSTTSAQLAPETSISVKMTIKGTIGATQKFLTELNTRIPLSEVVTLSYANESTGLGVIFFYKHLPDKLQIPYTDPIRALQPDQLALLHTLSRWREASEQTLPALSQEIASPSGN